VPDPEMSYTFTTGWVKVFEGKDVQYVREFLVLPETEERVCSVIGQKQLWA
jgi:hypothetical protein